MGPFKYYVTLFLANFDPPPPLSQAVTPDRPPPPPPRNVTLTPTVKVNIGETACI